MCLIQYLGSHALEIFPSRSAEYVSRHATADKGDIQFACVFAWSNSGVGVQYPSGEVTYVDPDGVAITLCNLSDT